MSEVELREVEHFFGQTQILRGLSLRIESGEYVVLLGESGCGKTTSLQLIAGLQKPTRGSIFVAGRCVDNVSPRNRDVSMVFQNDALYPHLTVRGSLAFALRKKVAAAELSRRIDEAAELSGSSHLLDRYPERLSGGELRRAAIAKAIVRRASVRLMDEPLSALDATVRHSLGDDLLRWHGAVQGTTLHVTHDGQEAMRMADKIAVMEAGQIVQYAVPAEIYNRPQTRSVARAIGSPPINLLPADFDSDAIRGSGIGPLAKGGSGVKLGREIEIGVRGEAFHLLDSKQLVDQPGLTLTGQVTRVTRIDGTLHVHVIVAASKVVAVFSPPLTVEVLALEVGQPCRLFAAADQLHLFQTASGQRIETGSDG